MGTCVSTQANGNGNGNGVGVRIKPSTIKIIHVDGRLQEFKQPIVARHILSQNPNRFLCSLETMNVDSYVLQVPETEELQLGQIYFLLPLSQSHTYLSLPDLCTLAIRASTALRKHDGSSFFDGNNGVGLQSSFKIPADVNGIRINSQLSRDKR
ncbi:Hth-type transcriptional regulator [Thalictrum thalictroides]|uniref:Hth-type transcriptional regulator n=1 Tax=Thalictrum thalictroides TaxID=46969 RepID=A0A7J6WBC0_THATH|nr:Hth-type transcriptional regulator [Thalictrum thalictroides]